MKTLILILSLSFSFSSFCLPHLQTVPSVNLNQYLGKWYEIARYANNFQKDCAGTTAEYSQEKSFIRVTNSCQKISDTSKVKVASGYAVNSKDPSNAKLKVSFVPYFGRFGWFSGKYWIIELGENYEYAVIGEPKRKYLWILSRTKTLSEERYTSLLNKLENIHHYDTSKLIRTPTWL